MNPETMNAKTMNAETEWAQMLKGKGGDAPVAEIRPSQVTVHGRTVEDDYAWLKAANWQAVLKEIQNGCSRVGRLTADLRIL